MTADARLVVLERVVGDARATDAHMWVCFGGKERSTAAFEGLLGDAGFVTRRRRASSDRMRKRQVKQGGLG